jgi:hypothetical protein
MKKEYKSGVKALQRKLYEGCLTAFDTVIMSKNGRNAGIRTPGLLLPKQALYQAELHSGASTRFYTIFREFQALYFTTYPPLALLFSARAPNQGGAFFELLSYDAI